MEPHRHSEELRLRALERGRRLLEHDRDLQRNAPSASARARVLAATGSLASVAVACQVYADRPALGERAYVAEGAIPFRSTEDVDWVRLDQLIAWDNQRREERSAGIREMLAEPPWEESDEDDNR